MSENSTIEAEARARGLTVDALFREASEGVLEHMTPSARAAVLRREARRAGALREAGVTPKATTKLTVAELLARREAARAPATVATKDLTPELEVAFKSMGHSESSAKTAARGRTAPAQAGSLVDAGKALGLSASAAKTFARGRGVSEAVTDGSGFKATDYAYAPDENDSSTWRLLLVTKPGDGAAGAYAPDLVQAAVSALIATDLGGAPQVVIPEADLAKVKQTLAGAWVQAGLPSSDMPAALTQEALRVAFIKLGMKPEEAAIAAAGRERRA